MIPTRVQVLEMLKAASEEPRNRFWVKHSIGVGDAAGKLAEALNAAVRQNPETARIIQEVRYQTNATLDVEKITLLGYLHDIGKGLGPFQLHPENGYRYLKKLGFDDEYCEICLTHSFVNNDAFCSFSEFMEPGRDQFVIDFIARHQFTLEDKIVALCDMMYGTEMWTLDKRIVDIISRHGTCAQTAERIREVYRLKAYFEELLGYNLYELFPEVRENL